MIELQGASLSVNIFIFQFQYAATILASSPLQNKILPTPLLFLQNNYKVIHLNLLRMIDFGGFGVRRRRDTTTTASALSGPNFLKLTLMLYTQEEGIFTSFQVIFLQNCSNCHEYHDLRESKNVPTWVPTCFLYSTLDSQPYKRHVLEISGLCSSTNFLENNNKENTFDAVLSFLAGNVLIILTLTLPISRSW